MNFAWNFSSTWAALKVDRGFCGLLKAWGWDTWELVLIGKLFSPCSRILKTSGKKSKLELFYSIEYCPQTFSPDFLQTLSICVQEIYPECRLDCGNLSWWCRLEVTGSRKEVSSQDNTVNNLAKMMCFHWEGGRMRTKVLHKWIIKGNFPVSFILCEVMWLPLSKPQSSNFFVRKNFFRSLEILWGAFQSLIKLICFLFICSFPRFFLISPVSSISLERKVFAVSCLCLGAFYND